ncbi:hypothetical protein M3Y97_00825500 [Aphelenchoides bicaudatus]|nr:hypothetical protein M3Y97_00825500 [Aphelenchoides bicaudatus]
MRTRNLQRPNNNRNRATTSSFRAACDWLCCCASSSSSNSPDQNTTDNTRNTTRSAPQANYEVSNFASTTLSNSEIKASPTNKNCRKISPTNNNHRPVQNAALTQKVEPLDDQADDFKSNHTENSARKLTARSENDSAVLNLADNVTDPTLSLNGNSRKPSANAVFGSLIDKTASQNQRQFQKFSLVDSFNGTPYVKLTPRSARSVDATMSFNVNNATELDAVEEAPKVEPEVVERRPGRPCDYHRRMRGFIHPNNNPHIVPTAKNLHAKKKSGVTVPTWSPRERTVSSAEETSSTVDTSVDTSTFDRYNEYNGTEDLLVVEIDTRICPTYNLEAINDEMFTEILRLAEENTEFLRFQRSFIKWVNKQTKCFGSAFLLRAENNMAVCRIVENEQLFSDGFYCCGHDLLIQALGLHNIHTSPGTTSPDFHPENSEIQGPIAIDVQQLDTLISSDLYYLAELIYKNASTDPVPDRSEISASLCGIRSTCGFITTLIIVHQQKETRQQELDALLPNLEMIGSLTAAVSNLEEQRKASHLSQMIIDKTQKVLLSMQDMNLLVRNITKEAKALVSAEICSLFLMDRENKELVAEVFEKNSCSDEYLTEIRMPLSEGIVGHVARTGQIMNVSDVYKHPNFCPNVDKNTGFVTRNVLCFPIKDNAGNLVGVAELCNKIGKPAFTRHDEQVAQTFAVYCAISISHCLLYRKLQEAHRRSHMAAELLVQGSTFSISPEDILRLTVREIPTPESFHKDFNEFRFFPRLIGTGDMYVEAALSMFQELGLIERFRIRRRTLARFLLMVQKGYREVPYHNWGHAFAVTHFCYLLLRLEKVQNALDDLERLSLLTACLCHDIDHRGTTNSFQLQSKTPLAQLYSSEGSVLERHHFAQTVTILGLDECNIFDSLTRHEYQTVLDNMREIILATDLVAHLRKVERIQRMVNVGFNKDSSEHHYLFMCLLMTASDLSDQSKHFKHSKIIAENVYKEFFSQGDLEKQMGNEPSEMFNRERACVPKIQLEFTDTVSLKLFNCISKILPELNVTYKTLEMNRACWEALDNILLEEGVPSSSGLDYLRNDSIEKKVYERVKQQDKYSQLLESELTPSNSGEDKSK